MEQENSVKKTMNNGISHETQRQGEIQQNREMRQEQQSQIPPRNQNSSQNQIPPQAYGGLVKNAASAPQGSQINVPKTGALQMDAGQIGAEQTGAPQNNAPRTPPPYPISYQEPTEEKEKRGRLFETLAFPTLLYALVYTFLLYDNWAGITMPFFVAATAIYAGYVMKRTGIEKKKHTKWYLLMMFLLGVSDMLTGNAVIQTFNNIGIFLLLICMLLYQYFDVSRWGLGSYTKGIFAAVFGAVANILEPFSDGSAYFAADTQKQKKGKGVYVLIGIAAALPFLAVVTTLLYFADAVFADFLREGLKLDPQTVFLVLMFFAFAFLSAYCGMRWLDKRKLVAEPKDLRKWEPTVAITVTLLVGIVYAVFCGIQVVYLFWGKMDLPGDYTYAQYAREGFFQLLFVCMMNLGLVLFLQKFFREHGLLKILLTLICICTYVMVASSGLRMLMYIGAYQLTFLRVLVLWALVVIAVLLVGILCQIWKKNFPLFSYGLVTVCVCYLALSLGHVDYFIARYNLGHMEADSGEGTQANAEDAEKEGKTTDFSYLADLSTDAAPAIYQAIQSGQVSGGTDSDTDGRNSGADVAYSDWIYSYIYRIEQNTDDSWRQFNVSHALARSLFAEEIERYYDAVSVQLYNYSDQDVKNIIVTYYEGDTVLGSGGTAYADGSALVLGRCDNSSGIITGKMSAEDAPSNGTEKSLLMEFFRQDFAAAGRDIETISDFGISISFEDAEGNVYETPVCRLIYSSSQQRQRVYSVGIYGSREIGYELFTVSNY